MSIRLYSLEGCPYCEKVEEALVQADIEYQTTWVPALHSQRDEVRRISGQRNVPVLVDDTRGVTMSESDRILEYINQTLVPARSA